MHQSIALYLFSEVHNFNYNKNSLFCKKKQTGIFQSRFVQLIVIWNEILPSKYSCNASEQGRIWLAFHTFCLVNYYQALKFIVDLFKKWKPRLCHLKERRKGGKIDSKVSNKAQKWQKQNTKWMHVNCFAQCEETSFKEKREASSINSWVKNTTKNRSNNK